MGKKSKNALEKELAKEIEIMKQKLEEKRLAEIATTPSANAAVIIQDYCTAFGEQDSQALVNRLSDSIKKVAEGNDTKALQAILMGQAEALQSIFVNFSRRAVHQEMMCHFESFIKFALKAQSQCRATLETLAAIKNPPIVYAKQANISNGPQQVNNGATATAQASPAEKNKIEQNELMEAPKDEEGLDRRTQTATSAINKAMATVE